MAVSAVILTKNEEGNMKDCIASLSFCSEIIVIDDNSSDNTVSLAKKLGAKVITHPLINDFSQQRNFALAHTTHEWVLFIDADERVSRKLQKEILEVTMQSKISGYYIKRIDFMWGKFLKHGETGDLYFLRLAKKNTGKWVGKVHETWVSTQPIKELSSVLFHYPHVDMQEFLREINFYSTLRSQELFEQKEKTNIVQIWIYPYGKFFINYIVKSGFLDGIPGLLFAVCMSFHSFLVRGKLWQLWENASNQK